MKHDWLKMSVLCVSGLLASNAWAEDLLQVYQKAVKSDPQLLAEGASRQAVGELKAQAKARFLPQVTFSANEGYVSQDTSAQIFAGNRDYNQHGYRLSLTQPLYRRQNYVLNRQAGIAIDSAAASYQVAEQALILRVAERYFDLLGKQDDLTFAQAEREAIAQQLDQTQQRYDVGLATITDVVESKAAYDLANAAVINAQNEVDNSKERLRETAGIVIEHLDTLKADTPLVSPDPEDINAWTQKALKQNPALLVAHKAVENATQQIELAKSGHYPTLDVVAEKSYNSQSDSSFGGGIKTHQKSLRLQFNLPIYSGGSVTSKTRESGYRLDQAMQQEEQQRRLVMRQTREAYNSVMSGISRVKALAQAVKSNEKALESTQAGYEVGTRTTVDVLNVRRDLFRARRDYAQARYGYIVNTLRLKQATGIISVNDLNQINQWLASQ